MINQHLPPFTLTLIFLSGLLSISCKTGIEKDKVSSSDLPTFRHIVIDSASVHNPWAKIPGDINGDGKVDLIIGGQKGPLVWFRNPDWKMFHIASGGYDTVDGECGDIDGDGDNDIVMGGLFWYENPGASQLSSVEAWRTHLISEYPTHDIELADLNQDNRMDVITRNQSEFSTRKGNTIHLWINIGNEQWKEQILEGDHGEGLRVIDLDADQDVDVIAAGYWFENKGDQRWVRHNYTDWHPSANLAVADFNKDNRLDIVLTPSELAGQFHKISWFEQPQDLVGGEWIEHALVDSVECVIHGVDVADFDQDGAADIVYSEMHQGADPDEVVVLINVDLGQRWSKIVVSDKGSHSIEAVDINADGNPDIFGANWSGEYQPIELWINVK